MSLKRPRGHSTQANWPSNTNPNSTRRDVLASSSQWGRVQDASNGQEVPLLRIHVLSARGLPRSSGAVGMPDPYVVVKFNDEKVGETKADRKTRRPEWNQHFLIRSDLAEPDPPPDDDDDASNADDDDEQCVNGSGIGGVAVNQGASSSSAGPGTEAGGARGRGLCRCLKCRRNRKRGVEVELEVWDQYRRGEEAVEGSKPESEGRKGRAGYGSDISIGSTRSNSNNSKPEDLYDDRLFDVSFVARRFYQIKALQRVHTAVAGRNKLIGVCRISSTQLRHLGSSTVPADLYLRDPKGAWLWGRRGTIRVAVSLERLQANIVKTALHPSKAPIGVPLGAGVGAGGVALAAQKEAKGEDSPPAELSCKVLWNGQDFSTPSRWDKVFCITADNNQLWLDIRLHDPNLPRPTPSSYISAMQAAGPEDECEGQRHAPPPSRARSVASVIFKDARPYSRKDAGAAGYKDRRDRVAVMELSIGAAGGEEGGRRRGSGGRGSSYPSPAALSNGISDISTAGEGDDEVLGVASADATEGSPAYPTNEASLTRQRSDASADDSFVVVNATEAASPHPREELGTRAGSLAVASSPCAAPPNLSPLRYDLLPMSRALGVPACAGAAAASQAQAAAAGKEGGSAARGSAGGAAAAMSVATAAAAAAAFAVATAGVGALAAAATAGATAAVASAAVKTSSRSGERDGPAAVASEGVREDAMFTGKSPVAAMAAAVVAAGTSAVRSRIMPKQTSAVTECWDIDRSCILKMGGLLTLSTFDAQGIADMLNSREESMERMANTKEWHEMGFRVHWDSTKRRFAILNVSRASFVLRGSCSSMATELLGFGKGDYVSSPVAEALLDPQHPSDPPRRHMAVVGDLIPPPLLRPQWMRTAWGPPAMEIFRGGELRVQVWARQPAASILRPIHRRRRRRSVIGKLVQADDGSWLVGTALLDAAEVGRLATNGRSTKLPLLSPTAVWKYERSKGANGSAYPVPQSSIRSANRRDASSNLWGGLGPWWLKAPASMLSRQRQKWRRLKRRIAGQGAVDKSTPLGTGGAYVWWGFHPRCRRLGLVRRSLDLLEMERSGGGAEEEPSGSEADLISSRSDGAYNLLESVNRGNMGEGKVEGRVPALTAESGARLLGGNGTALFPDVVSGADALTVVGGRQEGEGGGDETGGGVVGHVWLSLKLRDPSILLMRVVRQWNMARDEASVQQRRVAQAEAKRLWMLMPGISLWRVLVQLIGISLLVSYCVTLTLRAYHSTSCRATFGCQEETDPKLASLREWQTLADNLLSAVSFLDMLLQFRTAYVDNKTKIVTSPKKVAYRYLRTWFIPDLWCSLPYSTMQPLLQPLLDEVEDAADSLSSTHADHSASRALHESVIKGADSPLSLWVFKLSRRLRIGKINGIRGTRAFKYLDDSAMGIHFTVKQVVDVVRGRRKVLVWMGKPPKRRGWLGKFFFRIGVTNKWTRIVLSYRLLGYAKVIGTLVRAMRVLAVAIRAVPRAARVVRLVAVFLRSYEGRRRSKDLHEASIVIQRRASRHMALKVAGRMQANLRRRTRAASESAINDIITTSAGVTSTGNADSGSRGGVGGTRPLQRRMSRGRQLSTPAPPTPSASLTLTLPPPTPNDSPMSRTFSGDSGRNAGVSFVGASAAAAAAAAARGDLSPVHRRRRPARGLPTPPPTLWPTFSFSRAVQSVGSSGGGGNDNGDGNSGQGEGDCGGEERAGGVQCEVLGREERESSIPAPQSESTDVSSCSEVCSERWSDLGTSGIEGLVQDSSCALEICAEDKAPVSPSPADHSTAFWHTPFIGRKSRARLGTLGTPPRIAASPLVVREHKAQMYDSGGIFNEIALGGSRRRGGEGGEGGGRYDDTSDAPGDGTKDLSSSGERQLRDVVRVRGSFSVGVADSRALVRRNSGRSRRSSSADQSSR